MSIQPPTNIGPLTLSKKLQKEWAAAEIAAAVATREEERQREAAMEADRERRIALAREAKMATGEAAALTPDTELVTSVADIFQRERDAQVREMLAEQARHDRERPTLLLPDAPSPLGAATRPEATQNLLNRPMTETERLKANQENRRRRRRGQ